MLGLPHRVKYITIQKPERIWASRVSDRQLIEIFPSWKEDDDGLVEQPRRDSIIDERGYREGDHGDL